MIKFACILALAFGTCSLIIWGLPPVLLKAELVVVMATALFLGFTNYAIRVPAFMKPVTGMAVVYIGVGAMFIDPRFLISAFLIGTGTRMVMASRLESITARVINPARDIVIRESDRVAVRD
jgi:hypothetical protein